MGHVLEGGSRTLFCSHNKPWAQARGVANRAERTKMGQGEIVDWERERDERRDEVQEKSRERMGDR